jgi:uncharacterized protein YegL
MRVDNFISKQEPKVISTEKKTIHIVHILDRSTSMAGSKLKAALQGINSEVEELKKDATVNYLFSFVHFGNDIVNSFWQIPIEKVVHINISANGCTALYQAIGETLEKFPQTNPVLVKIFTDGEENQSRGKYNNAFAVKTLIDSLEQKDFTITFVGTKTDVEEIQRNLSIAEGNTLVHDNTAEGVTRSFRKSMDATANYTANVAVGNFSKTLNFYQ